MPHVPYSPVSDVPVAATPPEDYQRIQSSPADFGGLIGAAEQRLGAEGEEAGNNLAQAAEIRQQRFNQIAGDDAMNKFMEQGDALTYGNPNDPTAPKGLYSLRGAEALSAGPEVTQKITQLREQIKSGLQNDAQRLQFDQQSNRYYQYKSAEISRHLDQQADVYGTATTEDGIAVAASQAGNTWNSDEALMHNLADAQQFSDKNVGLQYGANPDPAIVQRSQIIARTRVIKAAVDGAMASDPTTGPARAAQIVQKFGNLIDPGVREELNRQTKAYSDQISLTGQVQGYLGGTPPAPATKPPAGGAMPSSTDGGAPPEVLSAIHGQEHSGATQVSVNGASGEWQVTPGFFQRYAKPGESYANEADRATVAQRGLDDEWRMYGDPARVAVAYFSGDSNVAPPGNPTPWVADHKDGNGMPTSQYVQGFLARLQQAGFHAAAPAPGSTPPVAAPGVAQHDPAGVDRLAQLYLGAPTQAQQLYPNNPIMQQKFVQAARQNINELMMLQNRDEMERERQRKDAAEGAATNVLNVLHKDPTKFDPALIWNIPDNVMTWEEKQHLAEVANYQLTQAGIDPVHHAPGYTSVLAGITADPDAPNAVHSLRDIWSRAGEGGDLNRRDAAELATIFTQVHKDPDYATIKTRESSMLEFAKRRLTFPDVNLAPGFQIVDRAGQDIFNAQFVQTYLPIVDRAVASGKPEEIEKVLNEDYVTKLAAGMRSQKQIDEARLSATGMAPDEATIEKPGTPIPSAPQGLNAGAWSHIMTLPPTVKGVPYSHQAWATILQRMAANPEQGVKDFDAKFGAAGYDGQQILERLKRPAPQTAVVIGPDGIPLVVPQDQAPPARPAATAPPAPTTTPAAPNPGPGWLERHLPHMQHVPGVMTGLPESAPR